MAARPGGRVRNRSDVTEATGSNEDRSIDRTRERVLARSRERGGADGSAPAKGGFLRELRGWSDALFFAFVLAMFIRTYVFELFMIPTGSMTPALIGDEARQVSEFDWDRDGDEDIVVVDTPFQYPARRLQVHLRNAEGVFDETLILDAPNDETRAMFQAMRGDGPKETRNRGAGRRDMILVNKFAYWFGDPTRGDIIVFKVPDRPEHKSPFDKAKPVYIKRCVGLPGENVVTPPLLDYVVRAPGDPERISPDEFGGREFVVRTQPLIVDGEELRGEPWDRLPHFWGAQSPWNVLPDQSPHDYTISDDGVLMYGDNQFSSSDSRVWGEVPLNHLRGKAVLRYWPLRAISFLDNP